MDCDIRSRDWHLRQLKGIYGFRQKSETAEAELTKEIFREVGSSPSQAKIENHREKAKGSSVLRPKRINLKDH